MYEGHDEVNGVFVNQVVQEVEADSTTVTWFKVGMELCYRIPLG